MTVNRDLEKKIPVVGFVNCIHTVWCTLDSKFALPI